MAPKQPCWSDAVPVNTGESLSVTSIAKQLDQSIARYFGIVCRDGEPRDLLVGTGRLTCRAARLRRSPRMAVSLDAPLRYATREAGGLAVRRVAHPFSRSLHSPDSHRGCPILAHVARVGTMLPAPQKLLLTTRRPATEGVDQNAEDRQPEANDRFRAVSPELCASGARTNLRCLNAKCCVLSAGFLVGTGRFELPTPRTPSRSQD